ncbi:hypothetical protein N657DRAFT_634676 [Parathielavia appendiculata]|uniref:Uncharacterized protein n=1 Tax=Parathielavia appendiculata TaxID=2587402 RepID=A0AAN6TY11_9PEZI|nr:hypothetical protein N657DRAFT_634676 [Parathielavia appendiculata]
MAPNTSLQYLQAKFDPLLNPIDNCYVDQRSVCDEQNSVPCTNLAEGTTEACCPRLTSCRSCFKARKDLHCGYQYQSEQYGYVNNRSQLDRPGDWDHGHQQSRDPASQAGYPHLPPPPPPGTSQLAYGYHHDYSQATTIVGPPSYGYPEQPPEPVKVMDKHDYQPIELPAAR